MAYVHHDRLQVIDGSGQRLEECTPTEAAEFALFYPEDIFRIMVQPGFTSIKKHMATFWGVRRQVWVGYDAGGNLLREVVALRCPPFYPPYSGPLDDLSSEINPPDGFPNS